MSTDNTLNLQYSFFLVDERPFCLWDIDLKKRNLEFLESLDPSYYEYMANLHIQNIGEDDDARSKESQHAALAMRTVYSQALETLFALISAFIQAPRCIPAWINLYQNHELRNVIDKIHNHKHLLSQIKPEFLSWSSISEIVFQSLVFEDKEKEASVKDGFAQLWSRFASDFLDKEFNREYNSIKHGLRVRPGGFSFAFGPQSKPGVPAEKMTLLGKSDFGSGYLTADKIGDWNHHVQMKRHNRNWHPEDLGWGLHMAAMSISNVQSGAKILNGVKPEAVQFHSPTDLSAFLEPWNRSHKIGVTSMSGFGILIQPDYIEPFPKKRIIAGYEDGQDAGIRHLVFQDQSDSGENPTNET
jgi:hypothetical protein